MRNYVIDYVSPYHTRRTTPIRTILDVNLAKAHYCCCLQDFRGRQTPQSETIQCATRNVAGEVHGLMNLVWQMLLFDKTRSTGVHGTHKIREDCEHVQLGVFVRNLLVLTVEKFAHQDVQGVVLEELLVVILSTCV